MGELHWWSEQLVTWKRHSSTTPRSCDRNRYLPGRLGSYTSRSRQGDCGLRKNNWSTWSCRDVCCTGLREGQEECSPQDGQHICPSLRDQDGRNSIYQTNCSGMSDLGLVSSKALIYQAWTTRWQTKNPDKVQTSAEWKIHKEIFMGICTQLGPC